MNPVYPDSPTATQLGFTSDLFGGYLWVTDDAIFISAIFSLQPGKGHFRALLERLLETGKTIRVPTPSTRMRSILSSYGFTETTVYDEKFGTVELMVREAYHARATLSVA